MRNQYHEQRILDAFKQYRSYNNKRLKPFYDLLKLLKINPSSKEAKDFRRYLRFYPDDNSFSHITITPKVNRLISDYKKYDNICKNYRKLIDEYRHSYSTDEECDHYKAMLFMSKTFSEGF